MTSATLRSSFKHAFLFLVVLFSFVAVMPQQAKAQTADTVSTNDVEFTDVPSASQQIIANKKKTDSLDKVKGDSAKTSVADTNTTLKDAAAAEASASLWQLFIIGFLGGFAAFLLPCVYPMLPLTVSFFTKRGAQGRMRYGNLAYMAYPSYLFMWFLAC